MKIIGYTALLYGKDYLGYAIRSIIDYIEEYHIIYDRTGHGSHGSYTDRVCPDTRDELYAIAAEAAGDKLFWHDAGPFRHEGEQRDSIHLYAPDADVILVLDSDEIWPESTVKWATDRDGPCGRMMAARVRIPMVHFWRSFHKAVAHDPAFPERVIMPRWFGSALGIPTASDQSPICHMGYAQRSELVEYKQHTHGHRGEWRKDDWFNTVFMANAQTNCHPVGSEYWQTETVNPLDYMPAWMTEHPYFKMDVIP